MMGMFCGQTCSHLLHPTQVWYSEENGSKLPFLASAISSLMVVWGGQTKAHSLHPVHFSIASLNCASVMRLWVLASARLGLTAMATLIPTSPALVGSRMATPG